MNKSQRIRTDVTENTDKHIKVKLEQDTSSLEILSLVIDQKDTFPFYNCDYGILVGRAIANGGVGIPNAKISVFIPIDDDDKLREEIMAIYPYEKARDKNADGKRYNLLPRVAVINKDGFVQPKQPFGSFPIKEEVVTNETWLEVYEKYYKYTTVTNFGGDYMLYGVPIGIQVVHMSVDVTDIGKYSMTPATMVTNLGYSENLFTSDNRVKPQEDLDDLPHIETQEISTDVIPFCGDDENFDIGITRQDFRLRAEILSTFTLFGSAFTNGDGESWIDEDGDGQREPKKLYADHSNVRHMATNREAKVTEQIFYYPNTLSDDDIAEADETTDMVLMDSSLYGTIKQNGDFLFIIPCNRNKFITDEFGNEINVDDDSTIGVFREFKGFLVLEVDEEDLRLNSEYPMVDNITVRPVRYRYKFPQSNTTLGETLEKADFGTNVDAWRKQYYTFELDKIYSLARFHGLTSNTNANNNNDAYRGVKGFINSEFGVPKKYSYDVVNRLDVAPEYNVGVIQATDEGEILNSAKEFPTNRPSDGQFGANWMNFTIYFNQNGSIAFKDNSFGFLSSNCNFVPSVGTKTQNENDNPFTFWIGNTQPIAGGITNTKYIPRVDIHFTDIIEVPKSDILAINDELIKGFTSGDVTLTGTDYKNGNSSVPTGDIVVTGSGQIVPQGSGNINGEGGTATDPLTYFYKGLNESDCIKLVVDLGLV